MEEAHREEEKILSDSAKFLPVIARTLLYTKFKVLEGRAITSLFSLAEMAPGNLEMAVEDLRLEKLKMDSPCKQLSAFRFLRERFAIDESSLDEMMKRWLVKIGGKKRKRGM